MYNLIFGLYVGVDPKSVKTADPVWPNSLFSIFFFPFENYLKISINWNEYDRFTER